MDFKNVPIFIISYNRLTELREMINKLKEDGYKNIIVVDNASDDEKLLQYLDNLDCRVEFLNMNYGHKVVWESGLFDDIIMNTHYVVTDPDIIPIEECPDNYIEFFWNVLNEYSFVSKVGFSLKIDDLPVDNNNRMDIIRWESFFYDTVISTKPLLYKADIDTTFALYRPGKIDDFYSAIRTGKPYAARHLPWYWSTNNQTEEEKKYLNKGNMCGNTYANKENVKKLNYQIIKKLYDDPKLELNEWKKNIYKSYSRAHSSLYIYGAGMVGQRIAMFLLEEGIKVNGFIVSKMTNLNEVLRIEIYEISDIIDDIKMNNSGVILATTFIYKKEILELLYAKGCTDICSIEM